MDIYCPICGEPWDLDSLREEAEFRKTSVGRVYRDFRSRGCFAMWGARCADTTASPLIKTVYDLLGDDLDGAAVELEDLMLSGQLEE
jgi:hypothetical protein